MKFCWEKTLAPTGLYLQEFSLSGEQYWLLLAELALKYMEEVLML